MMEVLTDFATVQYFGVQTVSVGVYKVWKGSYDFASAAQLASLVLLFAVAVLAGERLMRGRARFTQQRRPRHAASSPCRSRAARPGWPPPPACSRSAVELLRPRRAGWPGWAVDHARGDGPPALDSGFAEALANCMSVALVAALTCVAAGSARSATRCGWAAAGWPRARPS